MPKVVVAQNGVVVNIYDSPDTVDAVTLWRVPDSQAVSVGDAFDDRDRQVDAVDATAFKILFRHENLIRELIRALRASSTTANTQATTAGLPTAANSADLTQPQFKAAVKSLL